MDRIGRMANLLRAAEPRLLDGLSNEDVARYCMFCVMRDWGYEEWVDVPGYRWGDTSPEYIEEAEELGYKAIYKDGKLVGFRKERAR